MQRLYKHNQTEESLHFVHKVHTIYLSEGTSSHFTYPPLTSAYLRYLCNQMQFVKNSPICYIWTYFCASTVKVPLTLHLANQILQWEVTENVKSLSGTINGTPSNCSSRLNALCDYLKKTFR